MTISPKIAAIASLLADSSRATILTSLLDGRFHTASELAYMASITPQTASFHLTKLITGNLVLVNKHGRHRYYQIANKEVAQILESFLSISPSPEVRSLKQSSQLKLLREARTCYDHLAGKLGVKITESMVKAGYIVRKERDFFLTTKGEDFLTDFGLDMNTIKSKRRSFSHACLDWSERNYHIAGALGNGLMKHFLSLGWIIQVPHNRVVKVTEKGKEGFKQSFNISI